MYQVISIQSLASGSGVSYLARAIADEAVADGQRVLLINAAPVTSTLNGEADTKYHYIGDVRTLFYDGNHAHWRHGLPPRHGRFAYPVEPGHYYDGEGRMRHDSLAGEHADAHQWLHPNILSLRAHYDSIVFDVPAKQIGLMKLVTCVSDQIYVIERRKPRAEIDDWEVAMLRADALIAGIDVHPVADMARALAKLASGGGGPSVSALAARQLPVWQ